MKELLQRVMLIFMVVALGATVADAREKMTGVNGIRFGWKYEKCVAALGNPQRAMTTQERNSQRQYSYAPATWGTVTWDNGVLDFYKNKLMQVGFSKTTSTSDMSAFEGAKSHLTDLYGTPSKLHDTDNNLLWRSANGNIAILQFVKNQGAHNSYSTLLYFIDNKQVQKKAKSAEGYLRSLMR